MTRSRPQPSGPVPVIRPLPGWIGSGPAENLEEAAFRAGAALAHLVAVADDPALPGALWRDRLALMAAERAVAVAGRRESAGALRDALCLTRPGDDPGPAGRVLLMWSRAVARPITAAHLGRALDGMAAERIALCLDAGGGTAVDRAARVVEAVLTDAPRAETEALILGDAVLALSLGLTHPVPVVALGMAARELRLRGDDLRLACHRAVVAGVGRAVPLAGDLVRGAARLQAALPMLRAKGAGRAADLFLSRDAVAPATLAREVPGGMSDRAARRLCERLVGLGALRELTGRETFRLYGV